MGSSGGGVGDEPQYVVAKYDYIAQGNQVKFSNLLSVSYFLFKDSRNYFVEFSYFLKC